MTANIEKRGKEERREGDGPGAPPRSAARDPVYPLYLVYAAEQFSTRWHGHRKTTNRRKRRREKGAGLVHGMGFSPYHLTIVVVSIGRTRRLIDRNHKRKRKRKRERGVGDRPAARLRHRFYSTTYTENTLHHHANCPVLQSFAGLRGGRGEKRRTKRHFFCRYCCLCSYPFLPEYRRHKKKEYGRGGFVFGVRLFYAKKGKVERKER